MTLNKKMLQFIDGVGLSKERVVIEIVCKMIFEIRNKHLLAKFTVVNRILPFIDHKVTVKPNYHLALLIIPHHAFLKIEKALFYSNVAYSKQYVSEKSCSFSHSKH